MMKGIAKSAAEGLSKASQPHAVLDDFLSQAQVSSHLSVFCAHTSRITSEGWDLMRSTAYTQRIQTSDWHAVPEGAHASSFSHWWVLPELTPQSAWEHQVVGVDTTSLRAEAEALKTAARGDWIVGRTGGGRTADAQGKTLTGQYLAQYSAQYLLINNHVCIGILFNVEALLTKSLWRKFQVPRRRDLLVARRAGCSLRAAGAARTVACSRPPGGRAQYFVACQAALGARRPHYANGGVLPPWLCRLLLPR
jgi:hypothetical protein